MVDIKYIVVLVSSSHSTLLYKRLKSRGFNVEFISSPSAIGRGCQKAVRFKESDIEFVREEIINNKLEIKGIYKVVKKGYIITYELVQ